MCISHSVMEGQRHNNPLTRVAFVYNGPKGMELAPNAHTGFQIYTLAQITVGYLLAICTLN